MREKKIRATLNKCLLSKVITYFKCALRKSSRSETERKPMPRRIRYKRAEERTLGVAKDMAPAEAENDIETLGGAAVIHESELVEPNDVELPRPYELPSSLASYFRNIGAIDLLTPAEEIELAARILEGDESARERMITA
ncbi:MAG: hypothetical protein ISQ14_05555, partial [Verrucomicrobiae bacterium]|nr:hypothetical protein [Verrucomicrobiae bacterium]